MHIILASSSINRKNLFEKMGIIFETVSPSYEEVIDPNTYPHNQVKKFAREKAYSVYSRYEKEENVLIMGFDSMICLEGKSIGKPKSKKGAFEMIQSFIGKPQSVITGISLIGNHKGKYFENTDRESTDIKFRSNITNCQIRKYLDFEDWKGKCGAYSILGTGIFFLEPFMGDFQNIIGVPVHKLGNMIWKVTGKSPISILNPG